MRGADKGGRRRLRAAVAVGTGLALILSVLWLDGRGAAAQHLAAGSGSLAGGTSPGSITPRSTSTSSCPTVSTPGWLHTCGAWIVNSAGYPVRLAGVTWDGMQTVDFVPAGLNYRPYMDILSTIKSLGFNTIRIPLSDQLVKDNDSITITKDIAKNHEFYGLHPLNVLDSIVAWGPAAGPDDHPR